MTKNIRNVLSASTLIGDDIENHHGENLGKLEDIMLNLHSGQIAYAVISFGGFLGLGEKLFAVPWNKLHVDQEKECIIFEVSKEQLESMPGFDKDNWPDMTDPKWESQINSYYDRF